MRRGVGSFFWLIERLILLVVGMLLYAGHGMMGCDCRRRFGGVDIGPILSI